MSENGTVIAFAGAIGSGKSTVSKKLAELTGFPIVSFGQYVRNFAESNGYDPEDRAVLQRLGQALVLQDVDKFVANVLNQVPDWKERGKNLIVDGLRHVEVRHALLHLLNGEANLKLVVVKVDEDTRQERATTDKAIEPRLLSRYDQDLTEAQITRILPAYKDLEVDGSLPTEMAAREVMRKFQLPDRALEAAE